MAKLDSLAGVAKMLSRRDRGVMAKGLDDTAKNVPLYFSGRTVAAGTALTAAAVLALPDDQWMAALADMTKESLAKFLSLIGVNPDSVKAVAADYNTSIKTLRTLGLAVAEGASLDDADDVNLAPEGSPPKRGLGVDISAVRAFHAQMNMMKVALSAAGGVPGLEAIIYFANESTIEDRQAMYEAIRSERTGR